MRFNREDRGNWRVYYKDGARLYCWQFEGRLRSGFYVCTRDGEPSHEVNPSNRPACPFTDDGHYTPEACALLSH